MTLSWRTPTVDEAAVEMLRVLGPLSPAERLDALALASKLACESDFLTRPAPQICCSCREQILDDDAEDGPISDVDGNLYHEGCYQP